MKFMLLMTGTKAEFDGYLTWSKEDLERNVGFMRDFAHELRERGAYVDAQGLAFPHEARMVRAGSDGLPVTDGVFPESKEFLAGYWIVDVESEEEAYELAARVSGAPGPNGVPGNIPIEVRRVMSGAEEFL
jgi:hypothetical protein